MDPALEFDWVTARQQCNPGNLFKRLRVGVEMDCVARNSSLTEAQRDDYISFQVKDVNSRAFRVHRNGANLVTQLDFEYDAAQIVVRDTERVIVSASVTFTDQRECRLQVNGVSVEDWQFRLSALEKLFFGF